MKVYKTKNKIISLENIYNISIVDDHLTEGTIIRVRYFNSVLDGNIIRCESKEEAEKILNEIYEILIEDIPLEEQKPKKTKLDELWEKANTQEPITLKDIGIEKDNYSGLEPMSYL